MAYRKISNDAKRAAVRLYERGLLNLVNILDCCGFSRRSWFRVLKLWRETGDVINHPTGIPREEMEFSLICMRSFIRLLLMNYN
ncbi:hypothetical protein BU15DRAFT_57411 [Melanogaster broomeanus]|nr:hypothetical protein BU15DRAFT_57411 [Melanogaster broomeanus]